MLQECCKCFRIPAFYILFVSILFLAMMEPNLSDFSAKESRELYKKYYSGDVLTEEDTNPLYYIRKDKRKSTVQYYQNEKQEREDFDNLQNQIKDQATKCVLLFDADTFMVKNARKQLKDYKRVENVSVSDEPSLGINQLLEVSYVDYAIIVFAFFLVLTLVTKEKELGIRPLTKCCEKGYRKIYSFKYASVFVITTVVYILSQLLKAVVLMHYYEMGDWSRSIQSIYQLSNSVLNLNVLQFVWIVYLARWIVLEMIISLIYAICLLFDKMIPTCIGAVSLLGIEAAMCNLISSSSIFVPFKYLNIIFLLNTKLWIGNYHNMNVLGFPVARFSISIFMMVVIYIFSVCTIARLYPNSEWIPKRSIFFVKRRTKEICEKMVPQKNLLVWEQIKLLKHQKSAIVFVVLIFISVITFHPHSTYSIDLDELFYNNYHCELAGKITPEKKQFIESEQKKFDRLLAEYSINDEHDLFVQMVKDEIVQQKLQSYEAFQRIVEYYNYIKESNVKEFIYDTGYSWIFTNASKMNKLLLFVELILFILIAFSGIVVYEQSVGMKYLIKATNIGVRNLDRIKLLVSIGLYFVGFAIIYAPRIIGIKMVYGMPGLSAPANSLECLQFLPHEISLLGALIGYHVLLLLIGLVFLLITYIISKKSNSITQSLIVSGIFGVVFIGLYWFA